MTEQIVRELVDGVWVTRPVAAGSGGSPFGSSYLATFNQSSTTLTGSQVAMAWDVPPDVADGADVTLSGDGLTFTVVTTGWYAVTIGVQLTLSADTLVAAKTLLDTSNLDAGDILKDANWFLIQIANGVGLGSGVLQDNLVFPATNLTAGDTFQVKAQYVGSLTGTAPSWDGLITIVRLA